MEKAHWKLVIFHGGRRIVKPIADKQKLADSYRELKRRGVKVHIVSRVHGYWPKNDDPGPEHPDMLWCPYCRKWRWFSIPTERKEPKDLVPMSEEYFDAMYRRVLISSLTPWCQWCQISMNDFHVRQMNDMWGWAPRRRRTRRKRAPVRRRR